MKYEYLKGSEKDFEGAPEWATECVWNDKAGESFSYWLNPKENKMLAPWMNGSPDIWAGIYGHRNYIKAERRPINEQVWDGEGLMPSVGMKCLAKQCSQINADEFLVVAIQDGAVFGFWTATGAATGLDVNRWIFLPIRSPEDVARDEAIEAIKNKLLVRHEVAESFYDFIASGNIPTLCIKNN